MITLNEDDMRVFLRAGCNRDTQDVLSIFERLLKEVRIENDTLTDIELYRSQGKAQTLSWILETFGKAGEYLDAAQQSGAISS